MTSLTWSCPPPCVQAIEGEGVQGVAVLVTRYFGGTKLGAGEVPALLPVPLLLPSALRKACLPTYLPALPACAACAACWHKHHAPHTRPCTAAALPLMHAGGLVRAYGGSARDCLRAAPKWVGSDVKCSAGLCGTVCVMQRE